MSNQELILAAIRENGPMTSDDLEVFLEKSHQTISAQIRKLVQGGDLQNSGEMGSTRSGRPAIRWGIV